LAESKFIYISLGCKGKEIFWSNKLDESKIKALTEGLYNIIDKYNLKETESSLI